MKHKVFAASLLGIWLSGAAPQPAHIAQAAPKPCFTRQDLLARSPGFLEKVYVADGAKVKPGDVIAELDSRLLKAALKEARAGLDAARASLALAKDAAHRLDKLKGSDSVSEQELFQVKVRVDQAKASVDQAEGAHERISFQVQDTMIKAAIDGEVHGLPQALGIYLQAGQSLGRIEAKGTGCRATP
jgi:RND family efflux transporter MFP subunit